MALHNLFATTNRARGLLSLSAAAGALALALAGASPAAAEECKFDPVGPINVETGAEPMLHIDGVCTDPAYNESTFVIDKVEELTFQMPDGGPLVPYTEVSGHFPATQTYETLPAPFRTSPTVNEQKYVFRFPAKEFWKNRSFQQQHPTGGGVVDNRMAFVNGAFSINWMSAGSGNSVATHRVHAGATLVARAYANKLYDNTDKIYSYMWGCSGGGIVGMAAAENTVGIWDGVQPDCLGPTGTGSIHSFHWQAMYTAGIPQEKRDAIAAAAVPGGTGDIYAGLNEEEKAVLTEFISAGYPLAAIGNHFKGLDLPLVPPIGVRMADPSYENDFWSKPGYAGVNPPNWVKAALVDGWATITDITRDESGAPIAIQFDPSTVPALGTIGDAYLEYWVYSPDGQTRLIDPEIGIGPTALGKARYGLTGVFDREAAKMALTGTYPQRWGPDLHYQNSKLLLDGLKVGGKVRITNRFIISMYFYPRYSNIPGSRSYDQYRNADGSPKHPQREDISVLTTGNYPTMGGRVETGKVRTKTMIMEGMADNLSWPLFNASYAEQIERALGKDKTEQTMRLYIHDNGRHSTGGGEPGVFQQSIQDLMAWAERGVAPPKSSQYTIRNGQVILHAEAADRHGLQPVMQITANGGARAEVGVGEAVNLAGKLEMPPGGGKIVQYGWTIDGKDEGMTALENPQPLVNVARSLSFDKPGTYVVRMTVNGQRDGLLNPANMTLMQNFRDVQIVVE